MYEYSCSPLSKGLYAEFSAGRLSERTMDGAVLAAHLASHHSQLLLHAYTGRGMHIYG